MNRFAPLGFTLLLLLPAAAWAEAPGHLPLLLGLRTEFILFGLTLLGVAIWHHHTLKVALVGLAAVLALKLGFTEFDLTTHLHHEWRLLVNLLGLLLGFALLTRHFEESRIPDILPSFLPSTWEGCFMLLSLVFVLSAFLDNIPLTKLALDQGGYDWGLLAYAVGCGGSMIWFGSSAGVALSTRFPQVRSVGSWLRHGWHVGVGSVLGFLIMLWVLGWNPLPGN